MIMRVSGATVLITGASSGIGAALALACAQNGGRVALLARTASTLEWLAATIRSAGGVARAYPCDITDANAVERVVAQITAELGPPQLVVNNAGAGRWLFVEETSPQEAAAMVALPYLGAFYVTKACMSHVIAQRGHFVFVNSPAALVPWPGATGYTAARWALRGFTAALRTDLRGTGVRITQVIPGFVASSYFANNPGVLERIPGIARWLLPKLTPTQAAYTILAAIERDQAEIVFPTMLRIMQIVDYLIPGLIPGLAAITGARRGE